MSEESKKKRPRLVGREPTAAELEELEDKHGDVLVMRGHPQMSPYLVVIRRPKRQEMIGYKTHAKKEGQNMTANEALLKRIVVFPDPAQSTELDMFLETWSFFPDGIINSKVFNDFCGINTDADLKE